VIGNSSSSGVIVVVRYRIDDRRSQNIGYIEGGKREAGKFKINIYKKKY
jgi:hypothetical protein